MTTKMIKIDNISKDRKTFEMYACGQFLTDIQMNLLQNKKTVLETIMTELLFPGSKKAKTFRDTKPKLVEKILTHLRFEEAENPDDWEEIPLSIPEKGVTQFYVPRGKYYCGDLCYNLKDSIYDGVWGDKFGYKDGLYRRKTDGAVFGMFGTGGDGVFQDINSGEEYSVDAGHLGVASLSICYEAECELGSIEFFADDRTECWSGYSVDEDSQMYTFGNVCVTQKGY